MAQVPLSSIKWYTYGNFEGSSFIGRVPYVPADSGLTFDEKLLAVTVAAEGGHYDAINMWDSGRLSVGLIQFIDVAPQFGVTNMLGAVADRCGVEAVTGPLAPALRLSNATFKRNPSGQWRFFIDGGVTEVKTVSQQEKLYFNGPNAKGSFTPERMTHAKTWAACMSDIWENKDACAVQEDFTFPKLGSFSFGAGRQILLNPNDNPGDDGWPGAIKAFYMSYSINLPSLASKMVAEGAASSRFPKWSPQWCLDIMYYFVFKGNVGVWNGRYNAKRPWLEKMFGVTLPRDVNDLSKRAWVTVAPPPAKVDPPPPPQPTPAPEQPHREPDVIVSPTTDIVVARPEPIMPQPSVEDGFFMKLLQFFPLGLGLGWRFVSWLIELIKG